MAALLLIAASADGCGYQWQLSRLANAERFDDIISPEDQLDGDATTLALEAYTAGILLPTDKPQVRARTASKHYSAIEAACRAAVDLFGEDADWVMRLLPMHHRDGIDFVIRQRRLLRDLEDTAEARKNIKFAKMIPSLIDMLVAAENRTFQLETILARVGQALHSGRGALDAGLNVRIDCPVPVVRSDGALGTGVQIVRLNLVKESAMLRSALLQAPRDPELLWRVSGGERPWTDIGLYTRWPNFERVHVLYEGTAPAVTGGDAAEPFFVEFFRWGTFEPQRNMPEKVALRRSEILRRLGMKLENAIPPGFLAGDLSRRDTQSACRNVYDLGSFVVLPLVAFHHAMQCARLVLRFGTRWGARVGETMQIRHGDNFMGTHIRDGEQQPYVTLKPKGKDYAKFGCDVGTLQLIRNVKDIAHVRWYSEEFDDRGRPSVPVTHYGNKTRHDIDDARHVLVGPNGQALRHSALVLFCRILMDGVIHLSSDDPLTPHDQRIMFASALGLRGVGYEQMGDLLHHNLGSSLTAKYDFSDLITSGDAAEQFNRQIDIDLIGRISHA
jgi:hypothetical protein